MYFVPLSRYAYEASARFLFSTVTSINMAYLILEVSKIVCLHMV